LEALEATPAGQDNAEAILDRLRRVDFGEDAQTSGLLVAALGRCGGEMGREWFDRALEQAKEGAWRQHLLCHGSEVGLVPIQELLSMIQNSTDTPLVHCLVEGIQSWAEAGHPISNEMIEVIFTRRNDADESLRLAVFHALSYLITSIGHQIPKLEFVSYFLGSFRDMAFPFRGEAAFTLAHWGDPNVDHELIVAALDPWENMDVQIAILGGFQGSVKRYVSGRNRFYDELFPLIFSRNARLQEAASDLMSQVHFPMLRLHGKAPAHREALTRRCAEDGFLAFDDLFIDEKGQIVKLPDQAPLDVLIVTALNEEMDRIKPHLDNVRDDKFLTMKGWHSTLKADGGSLELGLLSFQGMGNPQAAAKTALVAQEYNPQLVILIGILGGRERNDLPEGERPLRGDVVVAEEIINYEHGKSRADQFEHRPDPLRCDERLLRMLKKRAQSTPGWAARMKVVRPDGQGDRILPRVIFGLVVSGEKVIADDTSLPALIKRFPGLVGVDMEGYGAALGSYETGARFLFVKGISDWADPKKRDDGWRPYATDAAATLVFDSLRSEAIPPRQTASPSPQTNGQPAIFSGITKYKICTKLGSNWEDLANVLTPEISGHERRQFRRGRECEDLWSWLENRGRLSELPAALRIIGREDLAQLLES